jgi:aspartyl-tRNA(Asn)/glutamyl-tRNA(Gln) amidotransferase subunit A
MKKLNTLTLVEAVKKLKAKEISHAELYGDIQAAIEKSNKALNAYLTLNDKALNQAKDMLELPLAGVPLAIKDNFLTEGITTTASSNVLRTFIPPFDSTVIRKLKESGGVVLGKTNMDAWAHGSSTETSDFGPTKNPRNTEHLPGGSSGGSAAAIASDMCIAAIGSETAGSIRQPAAWCGVVGIKPTYGRASRAGVVPMASSTDSPGPMGKTVEDCAIVLNHIAGKDKYDATTSEKSVPDFTKKMKKSIKGLRVGVCYVDHPKLKGTDAATSVEKAAKVFEKLGANVEMVGVSESLKKGYIFDPEYAVAIYTIVQRSEVSSNLAGYNGIRYDRGRSNFGAEAKRRIMLGTFTLTKGYADKYYINAQKVRSLYIKNYKELFQKYDVLISPTSPNYAEKLGASKGNPMYGELEDMLLEPCAISGLPGINVPCFRDPKTNLYIGLSIMSNYWEEEKMIQAAYAFEQATEWNQWVKEGHE